MVIRVESGLCMQSYSPRLTDQRRGSQASFPTYAQSLKS